MFKNKTKAQPMRPFTPEAMQQQQPSGYNFTLSKNSSQEQLHQYTSILESEVGDDVMKADGDRNRFVPLEFKRDKVQRVVERALSRQMDD
jgi:hypothetical protein